MRNQKPTLKMMKITYLRKRIKRSIGWAAWARIMRPDIVIDPLHSKNQNDGVISFISGASGASERNDPSLGASERNDTKNLW